jgi:hypothetical protein
MPFNNNSELYTAAPGSATNSIVNFMERKKFLKSNGTVSNPFQEKAHKRHNLLHKIG